MQPVWNLYANYQARLPSQRLASTSRHVRLRPVTSGYVLHVTATSHHVRSHTHPRKVRSQCTCTSCLLRSLSTCRYTSILLRLSLLCFTHTTFLVFVSFLMEDKTLPQKKGCESHCCCTCFIAVAWNQTCSIFEVCPCLYPLNIDINFLLSVLRGIFYLRRFVENIFRDNVSENKSLVTIPLLLGCSNN